MVYTSSRSFLENVLVEQAEMEFQKFRKSNPFINFMRVVLFSAILMPLVQSCGGGDSSASSSGRPSFDGQQTPGTNPFPSLALNGELSGRVFETDDASYIDLDTGEQVKLAGDSAFPSRNGTEVIELYEDFRFAANVSCGGFGGFFDRIVVRDAITGMEVDSFEISDDVYGPIRLSPDGQTLAAFWSKSHTCFDEGTSITIFSRQGEEIIRGVESINSYDWLPDNRLVLAIDQRIAVESERNTFRIRTLADMSDIAGTPGRIAVSPDGSHILFEMVTDNSLFISSVSFRDATVWGVNIDGSNLRRIATTSRTDDTGQTIDDPQVNMPVWSPDGEDFLLTENFTSGGLILTDDAFVVLDVLPVSNRGLTYVLKTDIGEQYLPPEAYSSTGVRPLLGSDLDGELSALAVRPFDTTMWSPAVPRADVVNGSLPAFDGRANRGLGGGVLYLSEDDNDLTTLYSMNLSGGSSSSQTTFDNDLIDHRSDFMGISSDGSLTAHHAYDSLSQQYLQVYDSSGLLLEDLAFITSDYDYEPESALRFSPVNNDLIGWIYDDGEFGTGAIILNKSTKIFVGRFSARDYDALIWTNEGNLLLVDEGRVYLSEVQGDEFGDLSLVFDFGAPIANPSVNPVNNDIAFSSGGQIFIVSIDGSNVRRVVAPSDGSANSPFWSPDGNFLVVTRDFEQYIVAADALNVRLYEDFKSVGGMQLGESASMDIPNGSTIVGWR